MALKLETIITALHATTGELKQIVTKLEAEVGKHARTGARELAVVAKDEITEKLLALISKLNK